MSWIEYNPMTGICVWKTKISRKVVVGKVAGCKRGGYVFIGLFGFYYPVHQLAWFYMTGKWIERVDHQDTDGENNRWSNLRPATRSQNAANRGPTRANKSGVKGVSWYPRTRKWVAYIVVGRRTKNLGYFEDLDLAAEAYAKAAVEHFGEYARTI